MADIQIEVQGQDAVAATEDLLLIPGLSGVFQTEDDVEREGTLTTIATIVGIVSGALTIAEQIQKWYQKYKSGKSIEKVLIVGQSGQRILLQNATTKQIKEILES
jgi:ethanolamine transporter EutH